MPVIEVLSQWHYQPTGGKEHRTKVHYEGEYMISQMYPYPTWVRDDLFT